MKIQPKQLRWLGDSLEQVKSFSGAARQSAGHQLFLVQNGLENLTGNPWKSSVQVLKKFEYGSRNPTEFSK